MRRVLVNFKKLELRVYSEVVNYYNVEHGKVLLKLNRFPLSLTGNRLVPGDPKARGFECSVEVLKGHEVNPNFYRMVKIKMAEYNIPQEDA